MRCRGTGRSKHGDDPAGEPREAMSIHDEVRRRDIQAGPIGIVRAMVDFEKVF